MPSIIASCESQIRDKATASTAIRIAFPQMGHAGQGLFGKETKHFPSGNVFHLGSIHLHYRNFAITLTPIAS